MPVPASNGEFWKLATLGVRRFGPVFLTHLHFDHTLGVPAIYRYHQFGDGAKLVMGGGPLTVFGPSGVTRFIDHVRAAFEPLDADVRADLPIAGQAVSPREVCYRDANIAVSAFAVPHKDGPAVGYRIQSRDRVIVISGDARPAEETVAACNGCDILFHEVFGLEFGPEGPRGPAMGHTSAAELGDLASRAKPKLLVLYHSVGASADALLMRVAKSFRGPITYARDLDIY